MTSYWCSLTNSDTGRNIIVSNIVMLINNNMVCFVKCTFALESLFSWFSLSSSSFSFLSVPKSVMKTAPQQRRSYRTEIISPHIINKGQNIRSFGPGTIFSPNIFRSTLNHFHNNLQHCFIKRRYKSIYSNIPFEGTIDILILSFHT